MSVVIDGTLGITSPAETVQGALTTTGNTILGDASTDTLNVGNGGLVKDASGNVGIGTAVPASKLHVRSDADALTVIGQIQNRNAGASAGGSIVFINSTNDLPDNRYSYIGAVTTGAAQNGNNLVFATNANGVAAVEQARIDSTGLFKFNSGYGSVATAYGCRAWVNFNGTGTVAIRASGNVSSITDVSVGNYTVNLTTAMPDVNYTRVVNKGVSGGFFTNAFDNITAPTVSTFLVGVRDGAGTYTDIEYIHVSVFR